MSMCAIAGTGPARRAARNSATRPRTNGSTRLSVNTPHVVCDPIATPTTRLETGDMTEGIELAAPSPPRGPTSRISRGRIGTFALVGGAGTVVNTAALYLLHARLHLPLIAASMIAVELAVVGNYLLNDRWTFRGYPSSVRRFAKFNASSLGGLAMNVVILSTLTNLGVHFLVANLVGIAAGFAVNFALSASWVWADGA